MKDYQVYREKSSRYVSRKSRRRGRLVTIALVAIVIVMVGFVSVPYLHGTEAENTVNRNVGTDLLLPTSSMDYTSPQRDQSPYETVGGGANEISFPEISSSELSEVTPSQVRYVKPFETDETLDFVKHRIESGESLWNIAKTYGLEMYTIASVNFEQLKHYDYVPANITLKIPNRDGILHTVKEGQSLWSLESMYGVSRKNIRKFNELESPYLQVNQKIFIPNASPRHPYKYSWLIGGNRGFIWPVDPEHRRISSKYGKRYHPIHERMIFHKGIDVAGGYRTEVRAAEDGRVVKAQKLGGYGKVVDIKHPNGQSTRYAHLSSYSVQYGETVRKGEIIGRIGQSGLATGPNLHFEIIDSDRKTLDPLDYLP